MLRYGKWIISHGNDKLPVIGNLMESETKVPGFFITSDNTVLYDPPGFLATTGDYQEILDSYSNAKMFKVGSKVRIIILVESSTIMSTRGGGFVEVAVRLRKLFGKAFVNVINSCLLMISKIDTVSLEDLIHNIRQIETDNGRLDP